MSSALLTELRTLIARHAELDSSALPRVHCTRSTEPSAPTPVFADATLALVVQGAKRTALGPHAFEYGAGSFLVTSVKVPLTTQVLRASTKEPFLGVGLTIRPAVVASLLRGADEAPPTTPLAIASSAASFELLDAFARYLRLLDAPHDVPILAESIEREIMWRAMQSPHGAALREIGLADSHLTSIQRAMGVLQKRFAEPLHVAELARAAHMSTATFHRHFRKVTTMSPIQYQKQLRLQEARTQLLTRAGDVGAVSLAVGYQSPSQFSRDYRRLFGLPPSEDVARARR